MHGAKKTAPPLTRLRAMLWVFHARSILSEQTTKGKNIMEQLPWEIEKIIEVANELQRNEGSAASTGERIAAAFVINRQECLPDMYSDMIEAWDRLDDWQPIVRLIKLDYMHLINPKV